MDEITTFTLQFGVDSTFIDTLTVTVSNLQDTLYKPPIPVGDAIYYWRAEAIDRAGNHSGYPYPWQFIVDTHSPEFKETIVWPDTSFQGPYTITSTITDSLTGVSSATLYYRISPDTAWVSVVMDITATPNEYKAEIPEVSEATRIDYYLEAKDIVGNVGRDPYNAPDGFYTFQGLGVEEDRARIPTQFALMQNAPNPCYHQTTISYQVPHDCHVQLKVYNLTGQVVRTLVDNQVRPDYYKVVWNGYDDRGSKLAGGIYFYKITAGEFTSLKKLILLR